MGLTLQYLNENKELQKTLKNGLNGSKHLIIYIQNGVQWTVL